MPPRSADKSFTEGGWRAIALSVLVHALIVAAAVWGWFTWKHDPPPTTLAIDGTLIDERALADISPPPAAAPPPAPAPEPQPEPVPEPEPEPVPEPPPEEIGPPKPDPAEAERRREEQEKIEQRQREETQRIEAEKAAAAKAAAKAASDKVAAEKAAAEKRRTDEAAAKKAVEERARLAREADLRRRLEAEERVARMRGSDEAARWHAQIIARIQRAWIRPPSARAGIECIVSVTQVPGGEVTAVRVVSCSGGDAALRGSVEAAVYRASPLPAPPDPALFERNLELTFAPTS